MTQQINLYNPVFLKSNPALEPSAWLAYAVAVVLVAVLGATALAQQRRQQLEAQAAAIEAGIKAEQEKSVDLAAQKAARKKTPELEAERMRLEMHVRARADGLALIRSGAIGSTIGFSGHMRALARQSLSGLWLTGFSIANNGSEVVLRGRMLDADLLPRFLTRLGAEKAFAGRAFKTLSIDQPKSAEASPVAGALPAYLSFEIATDAIGNAVSPGASQGAPGVAAGGRK